MTKFIIHLCIAIVFTTYIMASSKLDNLTAESDVNELWSLYKVEHNKSYNETEDAERFEIFKENVKRFIEHNAKFEKGEVTYTMGINQFADLKPGEFKGGFIPSKRPE